MQIPTSHCPHWLRPRWNNVEIKFYQRCFNVVSTSNTDVISTLCNFDNLRPDFVSFSTSDQCYFNVDPQCWNNVDPTLKCWLGKHLNIWRKYSYVLYRMVALELEEILEKSLCRSPVLETLCCNFVKTGLHRWHFPRKLAPFFGQTISQKHRWTTDWTWCSFV